MHYQLTCRRLTEQILDVSLDLDIPQGVSCFSLPKWRPGRYEYQNYVRNLADLTVTAENGQTIEWQQVSSHSWEVFVDQPTRIHLSYQYYANLPDAGGTFLCADGLLWNGITCMLYVEGRLDEACTLSIQLPDEWQIGGVSPEARQLSFADFHALVDTPLLASKSLQHHEFDIQGIQTHLWFWGDCQPDMVRMEADIRGYSLAQMKMFGDIPCTAYHYLYVMWPYPYRHGVEHQQSTVIAMGPGVKLMQPDHYQSFLEISSHELFHVWNVKALRPADMLPYDYGQENYSRLHYVTEGVTTYYGDLMLWKGGVHTFDQWINAVNKQLLRHYMGGGQAFVSLADASFQSWTHGYQSETYPNRKISFYTKGFIVAMMLDLCIRMKTQDAHSLDQVISQLYHELGKEGKGYTAADYQTLVEKVMQEDMQAFWDQYITGTASLEPLLNQVGQYVGLVTVPVVPPQPSVAWWGIRTKVQEKGKVIVDHLYADSVAAKAGIGKGDELVAISGRKIEGDLDEWLQYLKDAFRVEVHYFQRGQLRVATLPVQESPSFMIPQWVQMNNLSPAQAAHRNAWQQVKGNVPQL